MYIDRLFLSIFNKTLITILNKTDKPITKRCIYYLQESKQIIW